MSFAPAPFVKPLVFINKTGFGPTNLPEFPYPYQPYWKDERMGKIATFGSYQLSQNSGTSNVTNIRYQQQQGTAADKSNFFTQQQAFYSSASNALENEYELVETLKDMSKSNVRYGSAKSQQQQQQQQQQMRNQAKLPESIRGEPVVDPNKVILNAKQAKLLFQGGKRGKQWGNRGGYDDKSKGRRIREFFNDREVLNKDSAVKIKADFELVTSLDLPSLSKLLIKTLPVAQDLEHKGSLPEYDDSFERCSVKNTKPLKVSDVPFVYPGMLEDPVMEELILNETGNVYCTSELLSYLMCAPRSVKTWDLVFTRIGKIVLVDKRAEANLEILTVNETITERGLEKDDYRAKFPFNSQERLNCEATAVNQSLLCQVQKSKDTEEGPVKDHQVVSNVYRLFQLEDHKVVIRTQVHCQNSKKKGVNVYSLNEFDSKLSGNVDWRQKLDKQQGVVLGNELKINAAKIARWTCQSLMANVEQMKLGLVSRIHPEDANKHVIMGVSSFRPRDLAVQINLQEKNMWGIVKHVVDVLLAKEEGKYLLTRDPFKPMLRLYRVPMNAFEEDDEEEEDEDDVEGLVAVIPRDELDLEDDDEDEDED